MDYSNEIWKDITGFPGYQVSNKGRVRSFTNGAYGFRETPHLLHPGTDGHGRQFVILGPERKHRQVHRLEAIEFLPNPNNYPIVRHLDDNPKNNDISNLAWGDQRMNMEDCRRNGNLRMFTKEDIEKSSQKCRKPVKLTDPSCGDYLYFRSAREADRFIGCRERATSNAILYGYKVFGLVPEYINPDEIDEEVIYEDV